LVKKLSRTTDRKNHPQNNLPQRAQRFDEFKNKKRGIPPATRNKTMEVAACNRKIHFLCSF
jgi:hypothetical protein